MLSPRARLGVCSRPCLSPSVGVAFLPVSGPNFLPILNENDTAARRAKPHDGGRAALASSGVARFPTTGLGLHAVAPRQLLVVHGHDLKGFVFESVASRLFSCATARTA